MRLLWDFFQPSNSLFLLLLLGVALLIGGRRRAATWMLVPSCAILAAIVVLPVSSWLMVTLETRFPAPVLPAHIDGIITLGGTLDNETTESWKRPQGNEHMERLTEAAVLARRYPDATLLVSGGTWNHKERQSEAAIARMFYADLGVTLDRAVFEHRSRTTWENGLFSRDLVHPKPGQRWVLVTSALHMSRAVGVFRALGWDVIPYPVDYASTGAVTVRMTSVGKRLYEFDDVVREWLALASYHLMGRTSELFPR